MAPIPLEVKVKPDVKELEKELKKARKFSLGKATGLDSSKKRSEETNKRGFRRMAIGLTLIAAPILIFGKLLKSAVGFLSEISPPIKAFSKLFKVILTLLFLPLVPILIPVLKLMGKMAKSLAGGIGKVLSGEAKIGDVISGIFEDLDVRTVFSDAFQKFKDVLIEIWDAVKDPLGEAFDFLIEELKPVFVLFLEELGEFLGENFPTFLEAFVEGLKSGMEGLASTITEDLGNFWTALLAGVLIAAGTLFLFLLGGWVVALVGLLIAAIGVFLPKIIEFGTWLWDKLTETISLGLEILGNLGQWLSDKIKDIIEGVKSFFTGKANGGPVSSNTPILVGEKGPELFVPNSSGNIIPNNSLGGGGGLSFSPTINLNASINSELDIRRVAEQIAKIGAEELSRSTNSTRF